MNTVDAMSCLVVVAIVGILVLRWILVDWPGGASSCPEDEDGKSGIRTTKKP